MTKKIKDCKSNACGEKITINENNEKIIECLTCGKVEKVSEDEVISKRDD